MRLLAFTTPEAPRFTWVGTLQIVALGAVWGLLTGPLILVAAGRLRSGRAVGPTFGLFVFVLAAVPFALYSGFGGRLVAPALFLWLGAVTFPALFIVHGMAVSAMHRRGSLPEPADVRARAGPYRRRPSSTSGTSGERGG